MYTAVTRVIHQLFSFPVHTVSGDDGDRWYNFEVEGCAGAFPEDGEDGDPLSVSRDLAGRTYAVFSSGG